MNDSDYLEHIKKKLNIDDDFIIGFINISKRQLYRYKIGEHALPYTLKLLFNSWELLFDNNIPFSPQYTYYLNLKEEKVKIDEKISQFIYGY